MTFRILFAVVLFVVLDHTLFLALSDAAFRRVGRKAKYKRELVPPGVEIRRSPKCCKLIAKLPSSVEPVAITFGRTIILNTGTEITPELLKHELKHVQQYKRRGLFGFLVVYTYYQIAKGYYNNPLELEAEHAEVSAFVNATARAAQMIGPPIGELGKSRVAFGDASEAEHVA